MASVDDTSSSVNEISVAIEEVSKKCSFDPTIIKLTTFLKENIKHYESFNWIVTTLNAGGITCSYGLSTSGHSVTAGLGKIVIPSTPSFSISQGYVEYSNSVGDVCNKIESGFESVYSDVKSITEKIAC